MSVDVNIDTRKTKHSTEFVLDSACTINLTNNMINLKNYKSLKQSRYIRCASGKRLKIVGVGFIDKIGEVFYVPEATINLLSTLSLTQNGKNVLFTKDHVIVDGNVIGSLSGKLYVRNIEEEFCAPCVAEDEIFNDDNIVLQQNETPTIELLHRRYGHTNIEDIKALARLEAVTGYNISPQKSNPQQFHCEACAMSKAVQQSRDTTKKLPRPCVTAEKKELYFNCVYTDLIGPMQTKSTKGHFYGVTFTEMATRYRFFYPLKKKSETLSAFEQLNGNGIQDQNAKK